VIQIGLISDRSKDLIHNDIKEVYIVDAAEGLEFAGTSPPLFSAFFRLHHLYFPKF
jgi:hypothetical protein